MRKHLRTELGENSQQNKSLENQKGDTDALKNSLNAGILEPISI